MTKPQSQHRLVVDGMAHRGIAIPTIHKLSVIPQISGAKDSSGDLDYSKSLVALKS